MTSLLTQKELLYKLSIHRKAKDTGYVIGFLVALGINSNYIDVDCQILFKSLLDAGLIKQPLVREKVLSLWASGGSASLEEVKTEEVKTEEEGDGKEEDKTEEDKTEEDN